MRKIKDNGRTLVLKKARSYILNCYGCYFDEYHIKCPTGKDGFLACISTRKEVNYRETLPSKLSRATKPVRERLYIVACYIFPFILK